MRRLLWLWVHKSVFRSRESNYSGGIAVLIFQPVDFNKSYSMEGKFHLYGVIYCWNIARTDFFVTWNLQFRHASAILQTLSLFIKKDKGTLCHARTVF